MNDQIVKNVSLKHEHPFMIQKQINNQFWKQEMLVSKMIWNTDIVSMLYK